jgi:hypothetical protein
MDCFRLPPSLFERRWTGRATRRRDQVALRAGGKFSCGIKLISPVQSPPRKNIPFSFRPKSLQNSRRPAPREGRIAIVTDAGRDVVDAGGAKDESASFADGEVVWS